MDRTYASGASGLAPIVPASPSSGYPTAGNPGTGTPATKPGPWWYHMVMEELLTVILAGGVTPDKNTLSQLLSALRSAGVFLTPPQFDSTTKAATTEFVKKNSLQANQVSIGITQTLIAADCGKSFIGGAVSPFTITLPLASTCAVGARISFQNVNSGTMTIVRQGSDNINDGRSNASITLGLGGRLEIECLTSGQWYVVSSTGIGADQTWQNMNASRAFSTTYTNSSGKPIIVGVSVLNTIASSTVAVSLTIDGVVVSTQTNIASSTVGYTGIDVVGIVPPGSVYSVAVTQASLNIWRELR